MSAQRRTLILGVTAAIAFSTFAARSALAQAFPTKPVRLVIPWPPGGGTDIFGRLLAKELSALWGKPVVVENRPGAAGNIGAAAVAAASGDAHTLMLATITLASNAALYNDLPFDARTAFLPVTLVAGVPHVLLVRADSSMRSVSELIARAKANPGTLNYSSAGSGSPFHLAAELFSTLAGVKMTHVPYKGGAPAITAVISGEVDLTFANLTASLPHMKNGRLMALGLTSARRSQATPDTPTIAEAGLEGYDFTSWFGVFVPAGVPRSVVVQINRDVNGILREPNVEARLAADGAEVLAGSSDEFTMFMAAELAKWSKVVTATKMKVE